MRIRRGPLLLLLGAGALTFPGGGHAWAQDSHPGGLPDTCPEVLSGAPTGDLEMRTVPPGGSDVRGGDIITVTLRWNPESFDGPSVHKALDCVTVSGKFAPELSGQERDAPNDGLFQRLFTVPVDVPVGYRFCDRGFVSGSASGDSFERQKSNGTCFTVVPDDASPNGSPSPAAAPPTADGDAPTGSAPTGSGPNGSAPPGSAPLGSAPTDSGPTGSAPSGAVPVSTPNVATPPAHRTPEASSTTPVPVPTGGARPGAHPSPTMDRLPSPLSAPLTPDVHSAAALPTTGAGPTPLVLAGMILCAGGACVVAGVRRPPRAPSPLRRSA